MTEAWRIDSLDARAGMAFASYRPPDLTREEMPADGDAFFLRAPGFAPEVVASRAPGLAAARGGAQLGLFLEGREVGFESLEALREFVRRAYLSGSGGGEPEDEAPGPERPVSPEGDPESGERWGERPVASGILGILKAGDTAARQVGLLSMTEDNAAPSKPFDPEALIASGGAPEAERTIADGAAAVALALASSAPVADRGPRRDQWIRSILCLSAAMTHMGLWGGYFSSEDWKDLASGAESLLRDPRLDPEIAAYLQFLATGNPYYDDLGWPARSHDPLDDLADWPVSPAVAAVSGLAANATVLGVLGSISASPQRLAPAVDRAAARDAAAVFVFGAAHIVSWAGHHRRGASRASADGLHILFDQAARWISRQWPQMLFPGPIEAMIQSAARPAAARTRASSGGV